VENLLSETEEFSEEKRMVLTRKGFYDEEDENPAAWSPKRQSTSSKETPSCPKARRSSGRKKDSLTIKEKDALPYRRKKTHP